MTDQPVPAAQEPESAEALFDTEPSPQPQDPAPASLPPPSIADDVERPVDPRYVDLQKVIGWIVTSVMSAGWLLGSGILFLVSDLPVWANALLAALSALVIAALAWMSQVWPAIEHRHMAYRVNERGIEIRRGVWWRSVVSVPRSRVQHTDVSQGPIERGFGLATLKIYTAGTEHAEVSLAGLDHATALVIRDHLVSGGQDDAV